jgi:hypothetical protein
MKVIITTLKHIFIPHEHNEYKPHFFREVMVSMLLFVSIFLLGSSVGSSLFLHRTVLGASIASSVLIDLTNESRLAYNEPTLVRSTKLDQAAQLKGEDMARNGYFSHNSPEGITPWYWFRKVGYSFLYAGENLAINFTESSEVEKAWLDSPTHRANIMNVDFREIGMATVKGMYNNYPTIYIVQMFGTPTYAKAISDTATTTQVTKPVTITVASTTSKKITSPIVGSVKGESTTGASSTLAIANTVGTSTATTTATTSPLQPLVTTPEIAIVKNIESSDVVAKTQTPEVITYSTWYEKILFSGSRYVDIIYKILLIIVAFALVTMILVEVRKQHLIHILYGVFLLVLLVSCIFINQSFF